MKQLIALVFGILLLASVESQENSCELCQDLAYLGELFVQYKSWNSTQLEAEFQYLCSLLGTASTECDTIVDTFGQELASCLTTPPVNATVCCQDIFLCSSNPGKNPSSSLKEILAKL